MSALERDPIDPPAARLHSAGEALRNVARTGGIGAFDTLWITDLAADLETIALELEHGDPKPPPTTDGAALELLRSIDGRLAGLEAKFDEYEPLLAIVRERADRGSIWRNRKAPA